MRGVDARVAIDNAEYDPALDAICVLNQIYRRPGGISITRGLMM